MTDSPLISIGQQERAARQLMGDRAYVLAELATRVGDEPEATDDHDMERVAEALLALAERYAQWRTLRTVLGEQQRTQRRRTTTERT
jgi:hypothetical protein